jgi:hypothetical protein
MSSSWQKSNHTHSIMAQQSGRKRSHPATESLESDGSETSFSASKRKNYGDSRYDTVIFLRKTDISIEEMLVFLIDIMEKNSLIKGTKTEDVIARYHEAGDVFWCLETTSKEVAEKICYLNGIHCQQFLLRIERSKWWKGPKPKYRNYDEFKRSRVKEWPRPQLRVYMSKINASIHMIIAFINASMRKEGFMGSIADSDAIVNHEALEGGWCLFAASEDLAEKTCYLNKRICFRDRRLQLRRHSTCPKPIFSSWNKYHLHRYGRKCPDESDKLLVEVNLKEEKTQSEHHNAIATGETIELAAIRNENERLKKELAREEEIKNLKDEIAVLSKSNLCASEQASKVRMEYSEVKVTMSTQDEEMAEMRRKVTGLAQDLVTAQAQLNAVHQSWQEQVVIISEKDKAIQEKNQKITELAYQLFLLQKHSKDVTQSLLTGRS